MSKQTFPKALLLGDSIRNSYRPLVAEALRGAAEVIGPAENCQFSLYTLAALNRWLEQLGRPDIVHWNNGLHDVGHNPQRCPGRSHWTCTANLEFILRRLMETDALLIWATTTPVHPAAPFRTTQWAWRNEEIDRYNQAALELMSRHGVAVNDLHSIVAADPDRMLCEDQLHLSEAGKQKCAEAVAGAIKRHL